MTPAGTSNELDVQNGWEENTTHIAYSKKLEKVAVLLEYLRHSQIKLQSNCIAARVKKLTVRLWHHGVNIYSAQAVLRSGGNRLVLVLYPKR